MGKQAEAFFSVQTMPDFIDGPLHLHLFSSSAPSLLAPTYLTIVQHLDDLSVLGLSGMDGTLQRD